SAVVDHYLFVPYFAELLRHDASHDVGGASGRKWDHHAYRLARILAGRRAGRERYRERGQHHGAQSPVPSPVPHPVTWVRHCSPPVIFSFLSVRPIGGRF